MIGKVFNVLVYFKPLNWTFTDFELFEVLHKGALVTVLLRNPGLANRSNYKDGYIVISS